MFASSRGKRFCNSCLWLLVILKATGSGSSAATTDASLLASPTFPRSRQDGPSAAVRCRHCLCRDRQHAAWILPRRIVSISWSTTKTTETTTSSTRSRRASWDAGRSRLRAFPTPRLHVMSLGASWPSAVSLAVAPLSPPLAWATALSSELRGDVSFCLTAILLLSTLGITLERKTVLGKALSAPLATMAAALLAANLGVVPFSSPVYDLVNRFLVPLAVPMLLFDSDLRRVWRDTGSLLLAFVVGTVATVVGTVVAYRLLPLRSLADGGGWKVACALAARHIGGAINFVAVAETLRVSGTAVSAAIAADNVVVAIYFAILFALSKEGEGGAVEDDSDDEPVVSTPSELEYSIERPSKKGNSENEDHREAAITLPSLAAALSVASTLATAGRFLTRAILPDGTSSLPLISALTVVAATLFPAFFSRIRQAGTSLGILCIQMFFAASGAAGSIRLVLRQAPSLFVHSALQIAVHFVFLRVVGRVLLGLPDRELYLASNANVGGPTTAAAMAQAKHWKRLVLPALLIGMFGYATGTAIALALVPLLVRLQPLL